MKSADDGTFTTSVPKEAFDTFMEQLAREFLIGGKGTLDTRATPDEVFTKIFKGKSKLQEAFNVPIEKDEVKPPPAGGGGKGAPSGGSPEGGSSAKGGTAPTPPAPDGPGKRHAVKPEKADEFFASLTCSIADNRLKALVREIVVINYKNNPIAATFLFRALIEQTLNWCIDHSKLRPNFRKSLIKPGDTRPQRDPGLDDILKFVGQNEAFIFAESRVKSVLAHWSTQKQPMDMIIHGRWMEANATTLQQAAAQSRPMLQKILDMSALHPPTP